jgi:hypothetical protein
MLWSSLCNWQRNDATLGIIIWPDSVYRGYQANYDILGYIGATYLGMLGMHNFNMCTIGY